MVELLVLLGGVLRCAGGRTLVVLASKCSHEVLGPLSLAHSSPNVLLIHVVSESGEVVAGRVAGASTEEVAHALPILSLLASSRNVLLNWASTSSAAWNSDGIGLLNSGSGSLIAVLIGVVDPIVVRSLVDSSHAICVLSASIGVQLRRHILELIVSVHVCLDPLDLLNRMSSISAFLLGVI